MTGGGQDAGRGDWRRGAGWEALRAALDQRAKGAAAAMLPFYRRFPYRGPMGLFKVDPRGAYSPADGFFFNRIPKAANSTVMATLAAHSRYRRPFGGERDKQRFLRPSRLLPRDVERIAGGVFAFTFVRDPYRRVLSAFADKIVQRRPQSRRFFAWLGGDDGAPPRFADFLRFLEAGGLLTDAHWAPQCHLMLLPLERLDLVGRVESLETDLAHVLRAVFGTAAGAPVQSGPRTDSHAMIARCYTPEAASSVERLYAADFAAFGYAMRSAAAGDLRL
ncbi:hypothetical protein BH23PSE1_BH23PSE1_16720 [soil metagenome]